MTNSDVERFPFSAEDRAKDKATLWDGEVRGFGCRWFKASGVKTFLMQYRVASTGKILVMKIGRFNDPWKVDQARAKAVELKMRMVSGVDLREEERERRKAALEQEALDDALGTTLRQVLDHYLEHKRTKHGPLRRKTKHDIRRHVEKNLADWLTQPVSGITRDKCLAKFTAITERGAPVQANQCMRYLRALLNHARELHALPDGTYPILAANPVTQLTKLRKFNPEKTRSERIPLGKLGEIWNLLRDTASEGRTDVQRSASAWVATMILTGTRRTESGSLKRADVNLEAKTITLRGDVDDATDSFEGTKNHHAIVLHIAPALHEILDACMASKNEDTPAARRRRRERNSEYVFSGNGKKSPFITNAPKLFKAISKIAGCEITAHSCRRTFDDLAEACRIGADLKRHLTNHISGDVHFKHYANGQQNFAAAMEAIAKFVTDAAAVARAQARGENVIAFPGKPA